MDTIEKFLEKLRQTPRHWRITPSGQIRNAEGYSPLAAVYGTDSLASIPMQATLSDRIMVAEDTIKYPVVRQQLLDACGLTETMP